MALLPMMKLTRVHSLTKRTTLFLALSAALLASGCSSKEQVRKERQQTLEKFATTVSQHLLDRNPTTIRESMGQLTRQELTQPLVDKLQKNGQLPETELDVLKIIDDNQQKKRTNKVDVGIVRALGDVDSNQVQMRVTGKNIVSVDGKPSSDSVFTIDIMCELTPEMENYPRALDVTGLPKIGASTPDKASTSSGSSTRKRRRH